MSDGLIFANYFLTWRDGVPTDSSTAEAARLLFTRLLWWATALRGARAAHPYPQLAQPSLPK